MVAHSYGGFPASGALEQTGSRVSSIVWVDALIPENGERTIDLALEATRKAALAAIEGGELTLRAPPAELFLVNERDVAYVNSKITPHPVGDILFSQIALSGARERISEKDLHPLQPDFQVRASTAQLAFCKADATWTTGVYPFASTHETSEELFDKVYSLNVKVPYFLVAELAPLMAKRGRGAIVNLSTMVADYGAPGTSLYGSSKAAINLLTKTWTAEYGRSGVRINTVSPGPTRTEGTDSMGEGLDQLAAEAPAGRAATADEIAEAIVFLATDRSSFIQGAKLAVDGGRTAI